MISPHTTSAYSSLKGPSMKERSAIHHTPFRNYNSLADTMRSDRIDYETERHDFTMLPPRKKKKSQERNPKDNRKQKDNNAENASPHNVPSSQTTPLHFEDRHLPCRSHLDPQNTILPTSEWVHLDGTLPSTSLEEVLSSVESILYEEMTNTGVIDLDAMWNPIQDEGVPTIPFAEHDDNHPESHDDHYNKEDKNINVQQPYHVRVAHVVLSPFGRPTGWNLKLANASMVNSLLIRAASVPRIRVGWKMVLFKESKEDASYINHVNNFLVDDTMVRFENCEASLRREDLRTMLSRYELARTGPTVLHWKGVTNDGKRQLMFVARFLDPSWARAAVREMQDTQVNGKRLRLIQYPKQLLSRE